MAFHELKPGAVFGSRYRIVAAIGSGGASEVYRARDGIGDLEIALKVLYPSSGGTDLWRLRRELRIVRELRHPGFLRVHHIGSSDGLLYTVAELLEGESSRPDRSK